MAKGTAHCTCQMCGLEFIKEQKCYNRREADNWVRWAEGNYNLCEDCYREEQVREAKEATVGLPDLTGSEKQVAWATILRAQKIAELDGLMKKLTIKPGKEEQAAKVQAFIRGQIDSRYWIDNRFVDVMVLLKTVDQLISGQTQSN